MHESDTGSSPQSKIRPCSEFPARTCASSVWLRHHLTNFGSSICSRLSRTMTPFHKLFYFKKSQAVYSQSSQKLPEDFNLSGSYCNGACVLVWCGTVGFWAQCYRSLDVLTCTVGVTLEIMLRHKAVMLMIWVIKDSQLYDLSTTRDTSRSEDVQNKSDFKAIIKKKNHYKVEKLHSLNG